MRTIVVICALAGLLLLSGCAGPRKKGGYWVRYRPGDTIFYAVPRR